MRFRIPLQIIIRPLVENRIILALGMSVASGIVLGSRFPLNTANSFLRLIELERPPVFHAIVWGYDLFLYSTPFIACSMIFSLLYVHLYRSERELAEGSLPPYSNPRTRTDLNLIVGATLTLELESGELQGEFRPALTKLGQQGKQVEVYLYDTLPGGAGFSKQAGECGIEIFEQALNLLEGCPGQCDRSCYRCLRSYKNKFEHDLLDRHVGSVLLKYLMTGIVPEDEEHRTQEIRSLLVSDLLRQGVAGLVVAEDTLISIPGFGPLNAPITLSLHGSEPKIVDLSGAITPFRASDPELRKLEAPPAVSIKLINELEVQRNLPSATTSVLAFIGIDI